MSLLRAIVHALRVRLAFDSRLKVKNHMFQQAEMFATKQKHRRLSARLQSNGIESNRFGTSRSESMPRTLVAGRKQANSMLLLFAQLSHTPQQLEQAVNEARLNNGNAARAGVQIVLGHERLAVNPSEHVAGLEISRALVQHSKRRLHRILQLKQCERKQNGCVHLDFQSA